MDHVDGKMNWRQHPRPWGACLRAFLALDFCCYKRYYISNNPNFDLWLTRNGDCCVKSDFRQLDSRHRPRSWRNWRWVDQAAGLRTFCSKLQDTVTVSLNRADSLWRRMRLLDTQGWGETFDMGRQLKRRGRRATSSGAAAWDKAVIIPIHRSPLHAEYCIIHQTLVDGRCAGVAVGPPSWGQDLVQIHSIVVLPACYDLFTNKLDLRLANNAHWWIGHLICQWDYGSLLVSRSAN